MAEAATPWICFPLLKIAGAKGSYANQFRWIPARWRHHKNYQKTNWVTFPPYLMKKISEDQRQKSKYNQKNYVSAIYFIANKIKKESIRLKEMCVVIKYPLVLMFSCFVWVSWLVQICSRQQSEYVQLVNYAWVHDAGQQLGQDDFGIIEGKILGCIVDLLAIMDWGNPRDTRNCIPEVLVDTFHFPITKRMNFYEF